MTARHRFPLHARLAVVFCLSIFALPVCADSFQDAGKLLKLGQQEQALAKVEQYLSTKPKDAQGRFLKGIILSEMNRQADAIAVFTKLTEDYPELPEPYNNLAVIYAQQKQYDKAKQALEMAIRTHPSYATAHENLGDIYARLASQAYDKALQLDSSNSSAQSKLAMIRELMTASGHSVAAKTAVATASAAVPAAAPQLANEPKGEGSVVEATDTPPVEITPVVPAVAPVQATAPETSSNPVMTEVEKALLSWASAWSKKDVKSYLASYAKDFATPGGEKRLAWEAERSKRINKPGTIQVSFENLRVTVEGSDRVVAKFRQHYRSASMKTSSNKILVFVKRNEKWMILQERVGN